MKNKGLIILLALILATNFGFAQDDLMENLKSMLGENASSYLMPIAYGLGADFNSGFYHRARTHKTLGFDIGIKVMAAGIADEDKTFDFMLSENDIEFDFGDGINPISISFEDIYYGSDTEMPTIAGSEDIKTLDANPTWVKQKIRDQLAAQGVSSAVIDALEPEISTKVDALVQDIPLAGFDIPLVPIAMPQAAIGLPMGIEVIARGIPRIDLMGVAEIEALGGGIRVNLDQFIPIPLFPIDITAGAFFQSLGFYADDQKIIDAMNISYGLQVGKSINLLLFGLGVYADIGYESSSIDVAYTAEQVLDNGDVFEIPVSFEMETEAGLKYGAGIHIKAIPLTYIHLGFNQSPTNQVVTLGFGVSLR